jgi:hypothetical protein
MRDLGQTSLTIRNEFANFEDNGNPTPPAKVERPVITPPVCQMRSVFC